MPVHLILRLEAPLMAFGDTMIDATGPTRDMPNVSSITGLIANALGWTRGEREKHQSLQDRLVMGARLDREGTELRDFQTAQLAKNDEGWTTRGVPEGRAGGANTYNSPHIRYRFHRADAAVTVAFRLEPESSPEGGPTLAGIEAAFKLPARPLFIGRKPCLPAGPLLAGKIEAPDVLHALLQVEIEPEDGGFGRRARGPAKDPKPVRVVVPRRPDFSDGLITPDVRLARPLRSFRLADRRNWISGVHAGESELLDLSLPRDAFPPPAVRTQDAAA